MEITKGENANLAGMEPRCPECDVPDAMTFHGNCTVSCRACKKIFQPHLLADFAQFFRSPAPTPPLDVARDAARYWRLRLLGCAPVETKQLENGTVLRFSNLDEFVDHDIKIQSSRGEAELYERRHIASPAPQSEDEEYSHFDEATPIETADRPPKKGEKFRIVNVNKSCYKLYLFGHFIGACSSEVAVRSREKSIADGINRYIHKAVKKRLQEAASPAQPEKRDEWVSVEESGLPKVGHWCWVVYHGAVQRMAAQLAGKGFSCADGYEWRWADDSADPCPLEEITHWQPLPAPPQSGKEGQ